MEDYTSAKADADWTDSELAEPLLLTFNGRATGVITLDRIDPTCAAVRGVAIATAMQGQGHGRAMLQLVESFAVARGIETLCVNADPQKTGFYRSLGFVEQEWDTELLAICKAGLAWPTPVQMIKAI